MIRSFAFNFFENLAAGAVRFDTGSERITFPSNSDFSITGFQVFLAVTYDITSDKLVAIDSGNMDLLLTPNGNSFTRFRNRTSLAGWDAENPTDGLSFDLTKNDFFQVYGGLTFPPDQKFDLASYVYFPAIGAGGGNLKINVMVTIEGDGV